MKLYKCIILCALIALIGTGCNRKEDIAIVDEQQVREAVSIESDLSTDKDMGNDYEKPIGNENSANEKLLNSYFALQLIQLDYETIIQMFGEDYNLDEGLNTIELTYEKIPYTFMFLREDLGPTSPVVVVSMNEDVGYLDKGQPIIGLPLEDVTKKYGYQLSEYYDASVIGGGGPIAKLYINDYQVLVLMDATHMITEVFVQSLWEKDVTDYIGLDFVGKTFGEIKNLFGEVYYVDASESNYIVMYFGLPYYFMFDSRLPLNNESIVSIVSLEAGGEAFNEDPLFTISQAEFMTQYASHYDNVNLDEAMALVTFEYKGYAGVVLFSGESYPNQVMISQNPLSFGLDNEFIPKSGFDHIGLAYKELLNLYGEPESIDETGPYRYVSFDNVPYAFGFDKKEVMSDSISVVTVLVYFQKGGIFYPQFTYSNMSYKTFMETEAAYFMEIEYEEHENRLDFQDEYFYYYLFYIDDGNPVYMLIESK